MQQGTKDKIRKALRRSAIEVGYLLFLILLLECTLRLAGFLVLLPRYLDREVDTRSEGEFRILAIGESTTFGLGVDREMAYPEVLERNLNQGSGKKIVVVNVGVPGQTSTSILRNIRYQLDKYRPHLVLSLFGANDINEALNDMSSRVAFGFCVPRFVANLRVYRLACIIRDYALYAPKVEEHGAWVFFDPDQRSPNGDWVENPFFLEQLELNYGEIIEEIRSCGSRIVMLSYLRSNAALRARFEKISQEGEVPYIDLHSPETDSPEYFNEDFFHPNEKGHEAMAEKIEARLVELGLVPVKTSEASAPSSSRGR